VWELCGFTEAQCDVVNSVFIEVLAYWHLVLISGLHSKELCFVWEHLYPVWHDCGSPIVCMCGMIIFVIFTFGIELRYFTIRSF